MPRGVGDPVRQKFGALAELDAIAFRSTLGQRFLDEAA
jgi:hypothetical protein